MQIKPTYVIIYIALIAFCFLSAARDIISEILFKGNKYGGNTIFVLFVYSVVTQLVAGTVILLRQSPQFVVPNFKDVMSLNTFTLAAFFFYFLAIESPLGAGVNSVVDYGSSPVFTALVGALIAGERLDRKFASCAVASIAGIAIISAPRIFISDFSLLWIAGLLLSLLSSISSAFYRVYFRVLLLTGVAKSSIIMFRLFGITLTLGIIIVFRPNLFQMDILGETAIIGLVGFTLPLYLTLTILQRVTIARYSILLFSIPVLTFIFSAIIGYSEIFPSDILAATLVVTSVIVHERGKG